MAARVYIDTSVLVSAFSNESLQPTAMTLLQAPQWERVCVSDWTVAEFACALQAKVIRGETPTHVAHMIGQTLKNLIAQGALHRIAVLRRRELLPTRIGEAGKAGSLRALTNKPCQRGDRLQLGRQPMILVFGACINQLRSRRPATYQCRSEQYLVPAAA